MLARITTGASIFLWSQPRRASVIRLGALAQLEECALCKREVRGSKPRCSTSTFFVHVGFGPQSPKSVPTAKRDTRILVRYAVAHLQVATLAKRLMRLPRKQKVVSSNLTGGSFFFLFFSARNSSHFVKELFVHSASVPVAQLDKAPDYESGDWGFKSLLGYFFVRKTAHRKKNKNARSTGFEPATPRFEV